MWTHAARALENSVYFVRGNNVVLDPAKAGITRNTGVGYGDSYVMDPSGEIRAKPPACGRLHHGGDLSSRLSARSGLGAFPASAWSFREFAPLVQKVLEQRGG